MPTILPYALSSESIILPVTETEFDRSESGAERGRRYVLFTLEELRPVWKKCKQVDIDTVLNFYWTNRTAEFTFVWEANKLSYRAKFTDPPSYVYISPDNYTIRCVMKGYKL